MFGQPIDKLGGPNILAISEDEDHASHQDRLHILSGYHHQHIYAFRSFIQEGFNLIRDIGQLPPI